MNINVKPFGKFSGRFNGSQSCPTKFLRLCCLLKELQMSVR